MQLEVGTILEGTVTGLTNFGAFVALPDGKSGMVHISEVSNTFVKDIKEHLSEGQTVKVKILSIGDDGKISLSIKKAVETPKKPRNDRRNTWQGQQHQNSNEKMSFEDMMAKFKQESDEKISALKRGSDSRHGSSRRGGSKG